MTRFAFITWDGGGNVPPAVGLAQELTGRGHDVVFIGYEIQRGNFERRGLPFIALRESGRFDIYATTEPAQRIAGLISHVWACAEHLDEVPDALRETSADVLVVDFLMQGAIASATRSGVPSVVFAHSSIAGLTPPPESPMGSARLSATNGLRRHAGLQPLAKLEDAWAGLPTIVTSIPALDPAAEHAPRSVLYVGPLFERPPAERWRSPWDPGDERPLVLVSFTTTGLWDQSGRIRNTLAALAGEPVRVLASAGRSMELGPVPTNATVWPFVPHRQVLPSAAVTVSHGGHGTVAASLAAGVPIVALPNPAADQPFLAARIQSLGAGRALDGESEPSGIRAAVQEVLKDPSFAAAARRLSDEIRTAPGVAGAADSLERASIAAARS
jgi:MGT family glycosyltransferase